MDTTVYSNDRRVEVVQKEGQNGTSKRNNKRANSDWILHIHQAHPSDSGIYECQINTEPKKSKAYHLHIVGKYSLYTLYWHFLGSKICKSTKHFCTILPHFMYIFNLMDGHIEFRFVPVYFHIPSCLLFSASRIFKRELKLLALLHLCIFFCCSCSAI